MEKVMKKIAIYGKGGIGKSTTVSNLSAALSMGGFRVMQIGCDPKADSTRNLTGGRSVKTVLDVLREKKEPARLDDLVTTGFNGIFCVEAGGPTPGIGCAGRGIIAAFEKLEELRAYEACRPDIVLYDVLGDVVCGGFAMPMREGYADEVVIVSSGEMMALYAAYNIAQAIKNFAGRSYASLSGIILNRRNIENERALVEKAAAEIGTAIIGEIPRCSLVQDAEEEGKTVLEKFPSSEMSGVYRALAGIIAGEQLAAEAS
jgi:nitrogenase iron protein NifH